MSNYMRKIDEAEHPKIARLYATMSAQTIGDIYGVTRQAILNIVRRTGGKIRDHRKRAPYTLRGKKNGHAKR